MKHCEANHQASVYLFIYLFTWYCSQNSEKREHLALTSASLTGSLNNTATGSFWHVRSSMFLASISIAISLDAISSNMFCCSSSQVHKSVNLLSSSSWKNDALINDLDNFGIHHLKIFETCKTLMSLFLDH